MNGEKTPKLTKSNEPRKSLQTADNQSSPAEVKREQLIRMPREKIQTSVERSAKSFIRRAACSTPQKHFDKKSAETIVVESSNTSEENNKHEEESSATPSKPEAQVVTETVVGDVAPVVEQVVLEEEINQPTEVTLKQSSAEVG